MKTQSKNNTQNSTNHDTRHHVSEPKKSEQTGFDVVTGAFGFTGRYITEILLDKGVTVKTLTNHPDRADPFKGQVETMPYNFDDPGRMVEALRGARVVYNTYWVRFNYGQTTFGQAVANVQNLIAAAKEAGVKRFVHISIANPDINSPSEYYNGKAKMEETLRQSGLSYAILRPTVLFGTGDVLFNNIAWLLRKLPVFAIPGRGSYRIQPIYVGDLAELAVRAADSKENIEWDAAGPETFSFEQLVRLLRNTVKSRSLLVRLPPMLSLALTKLMDPFVGDVVLTKSEVEELMGERLVTMGRPLAPTRYSQWLRENADHIGVKYASELKRHFS